MLVGATAHLGLVSAGGIDDRYDFGQVLNNLLLLQAWGVHDTLTFNYVSWSLSGEWFAYLLLPVLAFAGLRFGLAGLIAILALMLGGLEWADRSAQNFTETWHDARSWGAYRIFADFIFGAILFCIAERLPQRFGSKAAAWLVLGASVIMMFADVHAYPILAAIGLAIVLAAVAERHAREDNGVMIAIAPITVLSYGVYMWHPVMETICFSVIWRLLLGAPQTIWFYPFALFAGFATIAVAYISLRFFEVPAANAIMATGNRFTVGKQAAPPNGWLEFPARSDYLHSREGCPFPLRIKSANWKS